MNDRAASQSFAPPPGVAQGVLPDAEQWQALQLEVARLRLLADAVPVAMAYFEATGHTCVLANRRYAELFGLEATDVVGKTFGQIIGTEAAREIAPYRQEVIQGQRRATYEREMQGPDGSTRNIEVHMQPHVGADGRTLGVSVLILDISHHRQVEAALREGEDRLTKFMHASQEGIVFHQGGLITDVNPPLLKLLGQTLPDMLGRPTLDFIAPEERSKVAAVIAAAPETNYDSVAVHRDGMRIPVQFIVRSLLHQGEMQRMTIVRDLRDRVDAERRIHHLAHHDALTGLPNRAAFSERLEHRLEQARHGGRTLALLFIDLDHFKRVNDSLGHSAGDHLLRTVAGRITDTLRVGDLVARFGGDEFLVLLAPRHGSEDEAAKSAVAGATGLAAEGHLAPPAAPHSPLQGLHPGAGVPASVIAAVADVAARLVAALGMPLHADGASISVTPSIGVALYPHDGHTPAELIQRADMAMYRAKTAGRARCCFFEPAMAEAAQAELALESRLAQAVSGGDFELHFQPQVDPRDAQRVLCIEARLRWRLPGRGLVGPEEFLPLVESRRFVLPISQWALRRALQAACRWGGADAHAVPVAVNLSGLQFVAADFAQTVEAALLEAGLPGHCLELELTERMLMEDLVADAGALQRLRRLGVRITVDDFGTGFTSLAHLRRLPLDRLKIDGSFIASLPDDAGAEAIARAVAHMGRGLQLAVVAEGVETEAQRAWVAQHCDAMLGSLVAPPMALDELLGWMNR